MEKSTIKGFLCSCLLFSALFTNGVQAQAIDLNRFIPDAMINIKAELEGHIEDFFTGEEREEEGIDLDLWGTEASDTEAVMRTVMALSQLMYRTEADLLFPANTYVTLFFSVAPGSKQFPQSAQISIDGQKVVSHRYKKSEQSAFKSAAVQRIYTSYLSDGEHKIEASIIVGKRRIRKSLTIIKGERPHFVELTLNGSSLQMKGWK